MLHVRAKHHNPSITQLTHCLQPFLRELHILIDEPKNLPLALLLAGDNLESTGVEGSRLLLLLLGTCAALLGHLRPATASRFVLSRARCAAVIDNALLGKLAAAEELFGEVAGVKSVACGVNGLGDELSIGRETQE